jgi:hypothetical protein
MDAPMQVIGGLEQHEHGDGQTDGAEGKQQSRIDTGQGQDAPQRPHHL